MKWSQEGRRKKRKQIGEQSEVEDEENGTARGKRQEGIGIGVKKEGE